jgi:hypothetical protein
MKTILPASYGSIRGFLNLLKRRDALLKICSLGASVAGCKDTFVQGMKESGGGIVLLRPE